MVSNIFSQRLRNCCEKDFRLIVCRNSQQVKYYQHMKPRVYCVETMGAQQDKIFIEEIIYTPSKGESHAIFTCFE